MTENDDKSFQLQLNLDDPTTNEKLLKENIQLHKQIAFLQSENKRLNQMRVLLATGRFAGEGFDDARLDTLFLVMPISWQGTLQQYAGRLHRQFESKREVQVYDYVDVQVPMFMRMYSKRLKGYKDMGYSETTK